MSDAQARVLAILALTLGIEALFSTEFQQTTKALRQGNLKDAMGSVRVGGIWAAGGAYALATLALVALAGPAPKVATWLAILVLVYALLAHGDQLVPFLANIRSTLSQMGATAKAGK